MSQFTTEQIQELRKKITKNRQDQEALSKQIEQQVQQIVTSKFSEDEVKKLQSLQQKENNVEHQHINLLRSLWETTQKQRLDFLRSKDEKDVLSKYFMDSTSDLSTKVFGKTTRVQQAAKGANPFLAGESQSDESMDIRDLDHDITTWELKADEIKLSGKVLGKGAFGVVEQGVLRNKAVAVKTIQPNWESEAEVQDILADFRNECAVMSKLLHPNVLLLMGVCIEEAGKNTKLIMVTELMARGSVYNLIHNPKKKIPFKQRMKFAKDAALGMNWLHLSKPPILHLDFKTQNLLVNAQWVAKVADFGLSRVKKGDKNNKGAKGSPAYMAPEVLGDKPYNEKADVYSFGIVLWELLTQDLPYGQLDFESLDEVYEHVVMEGKRPSIPDSCPPKLKKLIQDCLVENPDKRPSFREILESHVLDEVIVDAMISENNTLARQFWKEKFAAKEEIKEIVEWRKFVTELVKFCDVKFDDPKARTLDDQIEIKVLLLVLADPKTSLVTLENFSKILEWFGPFTKNKDFLNNVIETVKIPGFFGDLSSKDSEQMMAGKKPGTYMIRFSQTEPGSYTITVMPEDNKLQHYRIQHRAGLGFLLGDKEYSNLTSLIKKNRKKLFLKYPLPGSKYAGLFVAHETDQKSAYVSIVV